MKKIYFWKPDTSTEGEHLSFIISDKLSKSFLVVNMTKIKKGIPYDKSCKLLKDTLPEITDDSFIIYKRAMELSFVDIFNFQKKERYQNLLIRLMINYLLKFKKGLKKLNT